MQEYKRICFVTGFKKNYHRNEITIEQRCLNNPAAHNCFEYLKKLAEKISVKDEDDRSFLSRQYAKLSYIEENHRDKPLVVYKTAKGNHARGNYNQRQIDVIVEELLPEQGAIYDRYPVNEGHMLIIPRRQVEDFWASTPEERRALNDLMEECKELLDTKFKPDGYNIGINFGEAAGQSVFHLHVHLIPRYMGDIDNPRGGVRGVIPSRRIYWRSLNGL